MSAAFTKFPKQLETDFKQIETDFKSYVAAHTVLQLRLFFFCFHNECMKFIPGIKLSLPFQAYVRLVYLSYLELLINSRSELSLARVLNVPERELTHTAFTELKHEAKQKNMTMYQVCYRSPDEEASI